MNADLILVTLAGAIGYAGSLYIWPFRPHKRCGGTGRNPGSNGRRHGVCKSRRCNGGTVQRRGSKTIHRAMRAGRAGYRGSREK